jgi:hypothetical protein
VVVDEVVVGELVVVGSVRVWVERVVVVPEPSSSPELSARMMISAIARAITTQINRPMVQRLLVSTRATLFED